MRVRRVALPFRDVVMLEKVSLYHDSQRLVLGKFWCGGGENYTQRLWGSRMG
jgi:hypothetical protein